MGVDFYTCHYCDETFADCSDGIVWCDCGKRYCSFNCGEPDDLGTCIICRREYIPDDILLKFILEQSSLTRQEADQFYRDNFIEQFPGKN